MMTVQANAQREADEIIERKALIEARKQGRVRKPFGKFFVLFFRFWVLVFSLVVRETVALRPF